MTVEPRTRNVSESGVGGHEPANLGDILERVLDRGVVIVGDIRISLLDIELLTVKLRLLIASVDTARELGIDWWRHDPWLTSSATDGRADGHEVGGRAERRLQGHSREQDSLPPSTWDATQDAVEDRFR
jgi:gas vesicle protein GvpA/GvpJ/GvpM family